MRWDHWFVAFFLRACHALWRWVALHPLLGMLLICCVLTLVSGLLAGHIHLMAGDGPTLPWPWPV